MAICKKFIFTQICKHVLVQKFSKIVTKQNHSGYRRYLYHQGNEQTTGGTVEAAAIPFDTPVPGMPQPPPPPLPHSGSDGIKAKIWFKPCTAIVNIHQFK